MNKKIRVMHVLLTLGMAGLQKNVLQIINTFGGERFEFSICCLEDARSHDYGIKQGVEIYCMRKKPGREYLLPLKMALLFLKVRPDIVHTHDLATQIYGVIGALLAGVPVKINGEHGDLYLPTQGRRACVLRLLLSLCINAQHTTSNKLREDLLERTGMNKSKVTAIINGVDSDKYKMCPSTRGRYDFLRENDIVMATLGRLE
ncbi:MAG: glycosyltransferase, partial [Candidatus Omnitrophica bacterium]|nr:glycosyltransferase [Candidatus Omnitrophota bacterium]